MWLSLRVFAAVMLGSGGLLAYLDLPLATPTGRDVGVAAAVAAAVISTGYVVSRRHPAAAASRRVSVARGAVEALPDAPDDGRIRIGGTSPRLPEAAALRAFRPLLGLLALGIPVAGSLVGDLPAALRPLAWIGLLAVRPDSFASPSAG
jgi:hypothetical protein